MTHRVDEPARDFTALAEEPKAKRSQVVRLQLDELELVVIAMPVRRDPPPGLTPAEREVIHLVLDGLSNREIAAQRRTSVKTVANQLRCIYQRLGISSRYELAALLGG